MLKKSLIIICAVLILALVIGCSADSIASLGKGLGKLSDATLVPRNPYYVQKATENVEAFIEESEKAFEWNASSDPTVYDGTLKFKEETSKQFYLNTIDETVNILLSARDSSASDKALRNALNAKYKGLSYGKSDARKNLYDGLVKEATIGGLLVQLENPQLNLLMLLHFMGIDVNKEQIDSVKNGVQKLHDMNLPMPVQSCDYTLIIGIFMSRLSSVVSIVKSMSHADPGDKPKIDTSVFANFQKDIASSVNDRDYQTVGDKVAVGILFGIMNEMAEVSADFEEHCKPVDYDLFFDFLMADDGAKASMDKILGYFDALSYVYNSKLDIAGLVSGAF